MSYLIRQYRLKGVNLPRSGLLEPGFYSGSQKAAPPEKQRYTNESRKFRLIISMWNRGKLYHYPAGINAWRVISRRILGAIPEAEKLRTRWWNNTSYYYFGDNGWPNYLQQENIAF